MLWPGILVMAMGFRYVTQCGVEKKMEKLSCARGGPSKTKYPTQNGRSTLRLSAREFHKGEKDDSP